MADLGRGGYGDTDWRTSCSSSKFEEMLFFSELALHETERWIQVVTHERFKYPDDPRKSLENGILLCTLLNGLKPGCVKKINRLPTPIAGLDNVNVFLDVCQVAFGLKDSQLFSACDLEDLEIRGVLDPEEVEYETQKRLRNVSITIFWLGKSVRHWFKGPQLDFSAFTDLVSHQAYSPTACLEVKSSRPPQTSPSPVFTSYGHASNHKQQECSETLDLSSAYSSGFLDGDDVGLQSCDDSYDSLTSDTHSNVSHCKDKSSGYLGESWTEADSSRMPAVYDDKEKKWGEKTSARADQSYDEEDGTGNSDTEEARQARQAYDRFRFGSSSPVTRTSPSSSAALSPSSRLSTVHSPKAAAADPMQFVKATSGTQKMAVEAQETLEVMSYQKEIKKQEVQAEDDWQSNLSNWKSRVRRKLSTTQSHVPTLESEEPAETKKSKTFKEMQEDREKRKSGGYGIYPVDDDDDVSIKTNREKTSGYGIYPVDDDSSMEPVREKKRGFYGSYPVDDDNHVKVDREKKRGFYGSYPVDDDNSMQVDREKKRGFYGSYPVDDDNHMKVDREKKRGFYGSYPVDDDNHVKVDRDKKKSSFYGSYPVDDDSSLNAERNQKERDSYNDRSITVSPSSPKTYKEEEKLSAFGFAKAADQGQASHTKDLNNVGVELSATPGKLPDRTQEETVEIMTSSWHREEQMSPDVFTDEPKQSIGDPPSSKPPPIPNWETFPGMPSAAPPPQDGLGKEPNMVQKRAAVSPEDMKNDSTKKRVELLHRRSEFLGIQMEDMEEYKSLQAELAAPPRSEEAEWEKVEKITKVPPPSNHHDQHPQRHYQYSTNNTYPSDFSLAQKERELIENLEKEETAHLMQELQLDQDEFETGKPWVRQEYSEQSPKSPPHSLGVLQAVDINLDDYTLTRDMESLQDLQPRLESSKRFFDFDVEKQRMQKWNEEQEKKRQEQFEEDKHQLHKQHQQDLKYVKENEGESQKKDSILLEGEVTRQRELQEWKQKYDAERILALKEEEQKRKKEEEIRKKKEREEAARIKAKEDSWTRLHQQENNDRQHQQQRTAPWSKNRSPVEEKPPLITHAAKNLIASAQQYQDVQKGKETMGHPQQTVEKKEPKQIVIQQDIAVEEASQLRTERLRNEMDKENQREEERLRIRNEEIKQMEEKERELRLMEEKIRLEAEQLKLERERLLQEQKAQQRLSPRPTATVPAGRSSGTSSPTVHAMSRQEIKNLSVAPKPHYMANRGWLMPEDEDQPQPPSRMAYSEIMQQNIGSTSQHWVVEEAERRRLAEQTGKQRLQKLQSRQAQMHQEMVYQQQPQDPSPQQQRQQPATSTSYSRAAAPSPQPSSLSVSTAQSTDYNAYAYQYPSPSSPPGQCNFSTFRQPVTPTKDTDAHGRVSQPQPQPQPNRDNIKPPGYMDRVSSPSNSGKFIPRQPHSSPSPPQYAYPSQVARLGQQTSPGVSYHQPEASTGHVSAYYPTRAPAAVPHTNSYHSMQVSDAAPPVPPKPPRLLSTSGEESHAEMVAVGDNQYCAGCLQQIGHGAAMVIETLGLYYHLDCFRCCVCHMPLGCNERGGASVCVRVSKLHCRNCFSNDEVGLKYSKV